MIKLIITLLLITISGDNRVKFMKILIVDLLQLFAYYYFRVMGLLFIIYFIALIAI